MDSSTYASQLNQDCRGACGCARNAMIFQQEGTSIRSTYWSREAQAYTLESLGTDPFGFGRQG